MNFKNIITASLIVMILISCRDKKSTEQSGDLDEKISHKASLKVFEGNYVTEDYSRRAEGYDWVAVTISTLSDTEAYISVRSRADRKKPTCTFEGKAIKTDGEMLKVEFEGKPILLVFSGNSLTIKTEKEEDIDFLYYFCSGGGTLAGSYSKIDEPLDESQLKPAGFNKTLSFQGITFEIHASEQGSLNTLTIQPSGLEIINTLVVHDIDGNVTNAEIEDLNSDGSPEVLVYITSAGSGSYGSVIGYSVNNKKSMSQIYLPPIVDDAEISEGYMGHDEFAIIETTFARRFPIYKQGDSNSNPTGGIRQIQYKLVDGEASRFFKVDKVVEFPKE